MKFLKCLCWSRWTNLHKFWAQRSAALYKEICLINFSDIFHDDRVPTIKESELFLEKTFFAEMSFVNQIGLFPQRFPLKSWSLLSGPADGIKWAPCLTQHLNFPVPSLKTANFSLTTCSEKLYSIKFGPRTSKEHCTKNEVFH